MLWKILESQSILINAERRIGKTQVLRKMLLEPLEGWNPIFRDLENIHSAQEFAEQVYNDVQEHLGTVKRATGFLRKFFEDNETKYVNIKERSWKELLKSAVEDLMKTKAQKRLVFFWDEIPYMLESIRKKDGPEMAAEVLDTIRSLRVEQAEFRVIFTGSIGLHHILGKLASAGIPTSAKNDMYAVTVTPLAPVDGERLAKDLMAGEEVGSENPASAAAVIADEVDYFPFYIHHVIAGLKMDEIAATEDNVREYVARQLVDAADPWQIAHYRTRIATYYPDNDDAYKVEGILDVLAQTSDSTTVSQILELANTQGVQVTDRNDLLRLLRLLDADHYLTRENDGSYRFRFTLIRRWWKLDRGL